VSGCGAAVGAFSQGGCGAGSALVVTPGGGWASVEDGALEEEAPFGVEDGAGGAAWGGILSSGVGAAFAFFPVVCV